MVIHRTVVVGQQDHRDTLVFIVLFYDLYWDEFIIPMHNSIAQVKINYIAENMIFIKELVFRHPLVICPCIYQVPDLVVNNVPCANYSRIVTV